MKEIPLTLTVAEAKQLISYAIAIENEPIKGKKFWERHEVLIDKLHGVIYQSKGITPPKDVIRKR